MRVRFHNGSARLWLVLVGLAVLLTLTIGVPPAHAASVGQPGFDFHGTTIAGQEVSLSSYSGKPLILVFWASW